MADLPNRTELEERFARRMSRLMGRHRRELEELLGVPPDITRVPEEFWARVEKEMEDEAAALMLLILLQSANSTLGLIPDSPILNREMAAQRIVNDATAAAKVQAANLATGFVERSREMLGLAGQRWDEMAAEAAAASGPDIEVTAPQAPLGLPGEVSPEIPATTTQLGLPGSVWEDVIAEDTTSIFGPSRAEGIAVTETTQAASTGGEITIDATIGRSDNDTWFTAADNRVCPICGPLHQSPRSRWERFFPQGPPAHPRCRCWIQYAVEVGAGRRPEEPVLSR